jgi:AcrR family transcriptional regulator
MGRPKNFSREEGLEKATPVFWKHGFADTSLQDLERATGVNKSGLYTEFRDKEDLFVACFRHYLESQGKRGLLTKAPLGWKNVESFLKNGPLNKAEQQGCFSVNSMREFARPSGRGLWGRDGESGAIAAPSRHEHRGRKAQDGSFCNCRDGAVLLLRIMH